MAKLPIIVDLLYSDAWNDLTGDDVVMSVAKPIEIVRGRTEESSRANPSQTGLALLNGSGDFNPRNPSSPLFGAVGRNTPARVHLGVPHVGAANSSVGASVSHVAPSVDAPTGSGMLVCAWSGPLPSGTYTAPGDMTESIDQNDGIQTMMAARRIVTGVGATGTKTATISTSESYVANSVLIHGPTSITTGGVGGAGALTVDGNAGDWWVFICSFGWDDSDIDPPFFPWDTDGGGWVTLADTGTVNTGDANAANSRMVAWAKRVKTTNAAHTIELPEHSIDSVLSYLTRIPAADIDSVWSYRTHGEVSSWKPRRPLSPRVTPVTDLEIAGPLRRLTQGTPPQQSALHRTIFGANAAETPVAHWPMDGPRALTPGVPPMKVTDITGSSSPDLSWVTAELVTSIDSFSTAARAIYVRPVSDVAVGTSAVVDSVLTARPTTNTSSFTLSHRVGDFFTNVVITWASGVPTMTLTSNAGTVDTASSDDASTVWDEAPHHFRVTLTQNGANIDLVVTLDGVETMSGSTASTALAVGDGVLPGIISANGAEIVWGNVTLWDGSDVTPVADIAAAMLGYPGEVAGVRFARLCDELGLPYQVIGDPADTQPMGRQSVDSIGALMAEIESTDDGVVFDLREAVGLGMRTGRSRYNTLPVLTIDYSLYELASPTDPIVDDLLTRNDVTAANPSGASANAVQTSGPMNVNEPSIDPLGVGRYPHRVDVNAFSDLVLDDVASWHLAQGTVDETRWPDVVIDMSAASGLDAYVSSLELGDRIVITNHPDSADDISLILVGWAERMPSHHRMITMVCLPESPFHIAELEHDDYMIIGSDDATLGEALDTTETGVDIVCGNSRAFVHEVDFDILVGGERMTVTAVGAAAGTFPDETQTLTVTRSVNGLALTHAIGDPVELFHQSRYGL